MTISLLNPDLFDLPALAAMLADVPEAFADFLAERLAVLPMQTKAPSSGRQGSATYKSRIETLSDIP